MAASRPPPHTQYMMIWSPTTQPLHGCIQTSSTHTIHDDLESNNTTPSWLHPDLLHTQYMMIWSPTTQPLHGCIQTSSTHTIHDDLESNNTTPSWLHPDLLYTHNTWWSGVQQHNPFMAASRPPPHTQYMMIWSPTTQPLHGYIQTSSTHTIHDDLESNNTTPSWLHPDLLYTHNTWWSGVQQHNPFMATSRPHLHTQYMMIWSPTSQPLHGYIQTSSTTQYMMIWSPTTQPLHGCIQTSSTHTIHDDLESINTTPSWLHPDLLHTHTIHDDLESNNTTSSWLHPDLLYTHNTWWSGVQQRNLFMATSRPPLHTIHDDLESINTTPSWLHPDLLHTHTIHDDLESNNTTSSWLHPDLLHTHNTWWSGVQQHNPFMATSRPPLHTQYMMIWSPTTQPLHGCIQTSSTHTIHDDLESNNTTPSWLHPDLLHTHNTWWSGVQQHNPFMAASRPPPHTQYMMIWSPTTQPLHGCIQTSSTHTIHDDLESNNTTPSWLHPDLLYTHNTWWSGVQQHNPFMAASRPPPHTQYMMIWSPTTQPLHGYIQTSSTHTIHDDLESNNTTPSWLHPDLLYTHNTWWSGVQQHNLFMATSRPHLHTQYMMIWSPTSQPLHGYIQTSSTHTIHDDLESNNTTPSWLHPDLLYTHNTWWSGVHKHNPFMAASRPPPHTHNTWWSGVQQHNLFMATSRPPLHTQYMMIWSPTTQPLHGYIQISSTHNTWWSGVHKHNPFMAASRPPPHTHNTWWSGVQQHNLFMATSRPPPHTQYMMIWSPTTQPLHGYIQTSSTHTIHDDLESNNTTSSWLHPDLLYTHNTWWSGVQQHNPFMAASRPPLHAQYMMIWSPTTQPLHGCIQTSSTHTIHDDLESNNTTPSWLHPDLLHTHNTWWSGVQQHNPFMASSRPPLHTQYMMIWSPTTQPLHGCIQTSSTHTQYMMIWSPTTQPLHGCIQTSATHTIHDDLESNNTTPSWLHPDLPYTHNTWWSGVQQHNPFMAASRPPLHAQYMMIWSPTTQPLHGYIQTSSTHTIHDDLESNNTTPSWLHPDLLYTHNTWWSGVQQHNLFMAASRPPLHTQYMMIWSPTTQPLHGCIQTSSTHTQYMMIWSPTTQPLHGCIQTSSTHTQYMMIWSPTTQPLHGCIQTSSTHTIHDDLESNNTTPSWLHPDLLYTHNTWWSGVQQHNPFMATSRPPPHTQYMMIWSPTTQPLHGYIQTSSTHTIHDDLESNNTTPSWLHPDLLYTHNTWWSGVQQHNLFMATSRPHLHTQYMMIWSPTSQPLHGYIQTSSTHTIHDDLESNNTTPSWLHPDLLYTHNTWWSGVHKHNPFMAASRPPPHTHNTWWSGVQQHNLFMATSRPPLHTQYMMIWSPTTQPLHGYIQTSSTHNTWWSGVHKHNPFMAASRPPPHTHNTWWSGVQQHNLFMATSRPPPHTQYMMIWSPTTQPLHGYIQTSSTHTIHDDLESNNTTSSWLHPDLLYTHNTWWSGVQQHNPFMAASRPPLHAQYMMIWSPTTQPLHGCIQTSSTHTIHDDLESNNTTPSWLHPDLLHTHNTWWSGVQQHNPFMAASRPPLHTQYMMIWSPTTQPLHGCIQTSSTHTQYMMIWSPTTQPLHGCIQTSATHTIHDDLESNNTTPSWLHPDLPYTHNTWWSGVQQHNPFMAASRPPLHAQYMMIWSPTTQPLHGYIQTSSTHTIHDDLESNNTTPSWLHPDLLYTHNTWWSGVQQHNLFMAASRPPLHTQYMMIWSPTTQPLHGCIQTSSTHTQYMMIWSPTTQPLHGCIQTSSTHTIHDDLESNNTTSSWLHPDLLYTHTIHDDLESNNTTPSWLHPDLLHTHNTWWSGVQQHNPFMAASRPPLHAQYMMIWSPTTQPLHGCIQTSSTRTIHDDLESNNTTPSWLHPDLLYTHNTWWSGVQQHNLFMATSRPPLHTQYMMIWSPTTQPLHGCIQTSSTHTIHDDLESNNTTPSWLHPDLLHTHNTWWSGVQQHNLFMATSRPPPHTQYMMIWSPTTQPLHGYIQTSSTHTIHDDLESNNTTPSWLIQTSSTHTIHDDLESNNTTPSWLHPDLLHTHNTWWSGVQQHNPFMAHPDLLHTHNTWWSGVQQHNLFMATSRPPLHTQYMMIWSPTTQPLHGYIQTSSTHTIHDDLESNNTTPSWLHPDLLHTHNTWWSGVQQHNLFMATSRPPPHTQYMMIWSPTTQPLHGCIQTSSTHTIHDDLESNNTTPSWLHPDLLYTHNTWWSGVQQHNLFMAASRPPLHTQYMMIWSPTTQPLHGYIQTSSTHTIHDDLESNNTTPSWLIQTSSTHTIHDDLESNNTTPSWLHPDLLHTHNTWWSGVQQHNLFMATSRPPLHAQYMMIWSPTTQPLHGYIQTSSTHTIHDDLESNNTTPSWLHPDLLYTHNTWWSGVQQHNPFMAHPDLLHTHNTWWSGVQQHNLFMAASRPPLHTQYMMIWSPTTQPLHGSSRPPLHTQYMMIWSPTTQPLHGCIQTSSTHTIHDDLESNNTTSSWLHPDLLYTHNTWWSGVQQHNPFMATSRPPLQCLPTHHALHTTPSYPDDQISSVSES